VKREKSPPHSGLDVNVPAELLAAHKQLMAQSDDIVRALSDSLTNIIRLARENHSVKVDDILEHDGKVFIVVGVEVVIPWYSDQFVVDRLVVRRKTKKGTWSIARHSICYTRTGELQWPMYL